MVLEKLTKLNEPKRKAAAFLTVLAVVCICYFAITRDSVTQLKAANASYEDIQNVFTSTGNPQAELEGLQSQVIEKEKILQELQGQCFTAKQATYFFENINTLAMSYNLRPISRVISKEKNLVDYKHDDKINVEKQQFLKTQSASIAVSGNYFDIVDFMSQLTDRSQKVCITNVRMKLPAGEKLNPKTTFKVGLVIDLYKDMKK